MRLILDGIGDSNNNKKNIMDPSQSANNEEEPSVDEPSESVMNLMEPSPTPSMPSIADVLRNDFCGSMDESAQASYMSLIVSEGADSCSEIAKEALRNKQGVLCVPISNEGVIRGPGVRIHPNGVALTGNFEGDVDHIDSMRMSVVNREGIVMRGNIVNGSLEEADGEIALPGVGRYAGSIRRGVPHGLGVWFREDETWYEGQWRDGLRNGQGSEHYTDAIKYVGEWQNDKYHGRGEMHGPGVVFRGKWVNGVRSGRGELTEMCTMRQTFEIQYNSSGEEIQRMTIERAEIDRLREELEEAKRRVRPLPEPPTTANTSSPRDGSAALCKVCFARPITKALRPCNHACLCAECETRIREEATPDRLPGYSRGLIRIRCPVCRTSCMRSDNIILS